LSLKNDFSDLVDRASRAPAGEEILREIRDLADTLLEKNRKYGNSALEPVRVFSSSDPVEQIRVRLDDKLSRLQSGQSDEDEDIPLDIMGYLILLRLAQGDDDSSI